MGKSYLGTCGAPYLQLYCHVGVLSLWSAMGEWDYFHPLARIKSSSLYQCLVFRVISYPLPVFVRSTTPNVY